MSEVKDIFVSYSNVNKDKVEKIVSTMQFLGASCWFQLRDSKQHFIEEINEGINNSSRFVVFLSNASVQSLMVRNEISRAIYQQQKDESYAIVPVVIEELTDENQELIKLFLGSINWVYEEKFADVESLVMAIFEQANLIIKQDESERSSYSIEKEAEQIRLKAQNRFFNMYANGYLDEIWKKYDNPAVLDIGCEGADNIFLRIGDKPYRFLLGVDVNGEAVERANKAHASDKTAFVACDVVSAEFFRTMFSQMQKHKISGFDVIHISSVLLHLGKVSDLLKDLYMLLSEDGTIFIQDEDDGMNLAYPHSKFFDDCFYIWEHSKESGDRKMGRKLPLLLKEAGFKNVNVLSTTMSSVDFNEQFREELWDLYFNTDLWSTDSAAYFDNYEAFNLYEGVKEKHAEMKKAYMEGKYFITLGIFFITATKN